MKTSTQNSLPKTLQICQDQDVKFLNKLFSRDKSVGSSTRVYYTGISSSIPFTWETQPGTPRKFEIPKRTNVDVAAVLTPPPAYRNGGVVARGKGSSKSFKIFKNIFCLGIFKDRDGDCNNLSNERTMLNFEESCVSSYSMLFSSMSSSCSGSDSVVSFEEKA